MVTIVSVFVFVIVAIGLSYYCYKLKTENRIEPSEEVVITYMNDTLMLFVRSKEDHDVANGGVKSLEANPVIQP